MMRLEAIQVSELEGQCRECKRYLREKSLVKRPLNTGIRTGVMPGRGPICNHCDYLKKGKGKTELKVYSGELKNCNKCKEAVPVEDFGKSVYECKKCKAIRQKELRAKNKNKKVSIDSVMERIFHNQLDEYRRSKEISKNNTASIESLLERDFHNQLEEHIKNKEISI
jgi:ribosomal protein L37AE/L43A